MQFPGLLTHSEYLLKFQHIPTGHDVTFPGWVTQFDDQYSSQWNSTPTYGRMDPLATFQRTTRTISLGFDVVAANVVEARVNLDNISKFIRFLYPTYTGNEREAQNTLSGGPLLGFKWTNLVSDKGSTPGGMLYGYTNGFTYSPNIADGGFLTDPGAGTILGAEARAVGIPEVNWAKARTNPAFKLTDDAMAAVAAARPAQRNKISSFIPKTVSLNLQFTVLHTHLMGWNKGQFGGSVRGGSKANLTFPYLPNVATDPASGVVPGDELFNSGGESVGFSNDTLRNLAPEVDAAQKKALE